MKDSWMKYITKTYFIQLIIRTDFFSSLNKFSFFIANQFY